MLFSLALVFITVVNKNACSYYLQNGIYLTTQVVLLISKYISVFVSLLSIFPNKILFITFVNLFVLYINLMAFPTLGAQQETNRKILEDLQIKRQLLQKGVNPVADINLGTGLTTPLNQMPTTQLLGQPTDFPQTSSALTVPRSVFNPTSATTLGYFISQDSHYGNSFIPVLPRLDPIPSNHTTK